MHPGELAYLKELAEERTTMAEELESMNILLSTWKTNLYGTLPVHMYRLETLQTLPLNPLSWSSETIQLEMERVRKWKTQRKTIEQVAILLKASNDALEVPEGAFDDLGSQI